MVLDLDVHGWKNGSVLHINSVMVEFYEWVSARGRRASTMSCAGMKCRFVSPKTYVWL